MSVVKIPPRLFVAGTDTGVGKTLVSAILATGLKAVYWKPIQSGREEITDTDWMRTATGLPEEFFLPETYLLTQPLSPHAAAAQDGVSIRLTDFYLPDQAVYPRLIVEGAGGVMVPLNESHFMVDLMKYLRLPVLVVAENRLGTINHSLMTLEKLRQNGLAVIGVVLSGPPNEVNKSAIESYGHVNVIAQVDKLPKLNSRTILNAYDRYFRQTIF